ncbi:hypothetical protein Tco_1117443 [Tanacetum coccineum]
MEYCEDEDDCFTNFESEFPSIVLDDTSREALSWEPMISPLNDNEIEFRISFDESDDEDYTVIYDENSFSYKIISVDNLKTDSENDKVNIPLFPSPEPEVSYSNDLDFFKDFENEFPAIVYNDALTSKSDFLTEHIKKDAIFISQGKYVGEILKKFGFTEVKTTSTQMETQKPLLKDEDGKEVNVHMYRSMIGSLMYLTSSRPGIMFAVCACARYQVNPKVSDLYVVKRIFRLISWQCKKQSVVANSTTEAEYVAASSFYGQVL